MHKTEGVDNLVNMFTNGPPATRLEENWLNAVQKEICYVIEQAGLTLKTSATETGQQLKEALDLLLTAITNLNLTADLASDLSYSGAYATMQVDVNSVGFRSALHMDTDGHWIEADADAVATMPCEALALETGVGSKKVLTYGFIRDDSWNWTVGGLIYVSTTVGTLTQTPPNGAGDQVQVVGYATHADRMFFNPSYVLLEI